MPVEVLFVCTGNVCRSPAAALLTRAWGVPDAGLVVDSAGLAALTGQPVDPPVAAELAALGVPAADHAARQFEPWMALDADLVLTATGEQSRLVLRDVPQALRRVFTVKEFARLTGDIGDIAVHGPAVIEAAASLRGWVAAPPPGEDDVTDPYRRGAAAAGAAVADLVPAVRTMLAALGASGRADGGGASAPRRRPMPYPRQGPRRSG